MKRKMFSIFLVLCLFLAFPAPVLAASRYTTSAAKVRGSDYIADAVLASKLDAIFAGSLDMYTDIRCTSPAAAPLGSRNVPLGRTYYVKSAAGNVYSGTSCYIYANAVYATLFGDVPYHGENAGWKNSYKVASNLASASYSEFTRLNIGFGALLRTTANKDGSYSGNNGHSIIILDYDEDGITYLDGNGDGNGIIRVTERSWDTFNSTSVSGRGYRISFIVQPTKGFFAGNSKPSINHDYVGRIGRVRNYGGTFRDVRPADWFYTAVVGAYEAGFMDGRSLTDFVPQGNVTAAEAVTLCARFLSLYYDDRWDFSSKGAWYAGYYEYLNKWGINTSPDSPDEAVTRGDFAVLMALALPEEARGGSVSTVFPDVPPKYQSAVRALTECGVITGDNGLFLPYSNITRAEAAAFIGRMADRALRAS